MDKDKRLNLIKGSLSSSRPTLNRLCINDIVVCSTSTLNSINYWLWTQCSHWLL